MEGWKRFEGKKIYVVLKNNRRYSGKVLEIEGENGNTFIIIKDKFGSIVSFNVRDVDVLEEEREWKGIIG